MRRILTSLAIAIVCTSTCVSPVVAKDVSSQSAALNYIMDSERQWTSTNPHELELVKRILADDFVWVLDGNVKNKAFALADAEKGLGDTTLASLDYANVRFFGNTAVAQGASSWARKDGTSGKYVFIDTWVNRDGKWQIVASEDTTVNNPKTGMTPASNSAMRVVNAAVAAAQRLDGSALSGLYSNDALFVDEGEPYTWHGANVGVSWAAHVKHEFATIKMNSFVATAEKPTTTHISATGAYVVVPMALNGMTSRGPFHEDGAFTFTLRNENGTWKITSQTWTVR